MKTKKSILNIILAVTISGLVISGCKKKDEEELSVPPIPRHVTYRIICSDCSVFYYKAEMVQGTEYNQNSTWSYSFDGVKGDVVQLVAYNTSGTPQAVSATIMLNNDTLVSRTNYCPISGYSFIRDTLK